MASLNEIVVASTEFGNVVHPSAEAYDRQIRQHLSFLRRALSNQDLNSVLNDESVFDKLDPSKDSITYLLILRHQIKAAQEKAGKSTPAKLLPIGGLWRRMAYYLENFEPVQTRYVGQEWRQVVEVFAQTAEEFSQPILATQVIRDAILRLDPSSAVFTSTHLLFARLCLRAKTYSCALPVLKRPICHIPAALNGSNLRSAPLLCDDHQSSLAFLGEKSGFSSKLSHKEFLEYFLYGGMIFMAVKDWRNASHFLATVVSMPSVGVISKIMLEAYKKWILVGLLETGKLNTLPSITPSHASKTYHTLAKQYVQLAEAYERGDSRKFQERFDSGEERWKQDNNTGLVLQVSESLTAHFLKRIKKTFASLTISQLLEQDTPLPKDPAAAESIIASLITAGDLKATLVHSSNHSGDTMLRFSAGSNSSRLSHELDVQAQLKKEKLMLEVLMNRIDESKHNLALSDELVDHLRKGQSWTGAGENGADKDDGADIEEDIMVDFA
ncbi:hypothetical protein N7468_005737 [Penicillium chermesinum]|uniref:COP9 signalosome complex subunit 3 n=1 Tax=Penicillium chermesinum TaxID=63820 RepID=A0A9W9P043_9EURO|nr:uncharacterized protein N7468_005737 [Penicillium chermesinum]KAJ5232781.1 hypothetical protein N7468_005737 [Penicillium chermesinum]KAJ6172440.1 hypothetical protein N7470_001507 [Penicillium chermesinum]